MKDRLSPISRPTAWLSLTIAASFSLLPLAHAAEESDQKPAFDPTTAEAAPPPLPSPYDKLLALEETLGSEQIDWNGLSDSTAVDLDVNAIDDHETLAIALGLKIADGIVAIKSQNAENLNSAAAQIEAIATKLGATSDDLSRARLIRENANKGKWLAVFMDLGFLQSDLMEQLRQDERTSDRALVIAAGWLQGARYVTTIVEENYSPNSRTSSASRSSSKRSPPTLTSSLLTPATSPASPR